MESTFNVMVEEMAGEHVGACAESGAGTGLLYASHRITSGWEKTKY
jgi:hypothetical protein